MERSTDKKTSGQQLAVKMKKGLRRDDITLSGFEF